MSSNISRIITFTFGLITLGKVWTPLFSSATVLLKRWLCREVLYAIKLRNQTNLLKLKCTGNIAGLLYMNIYIQISMYRINHYLGFKYSDCFLYREVNHTSPKMGILGLTLNCIWFSKESGVFLYCHYSQVHSYSEWLYLIGSYVWV